MPPEGIVKFTNPVVIHFFVLSILGRAYPSEGMRPDTDISLLSPKQRGYVASWAQFLVDNGCPRVGVLDGYEQLLDAEASWLSRPRDCRGSVAVKAPPVAFEAPSTVDPQSRID